METNSFKTVLDPDDPQVIGAWDSASTPRRQTQVIFEAASPTLRDRPWFGTRYGAQICTPAAKTNGHDGPWTYGVRYWPSARMWTLSPLQEKMRWTEEVPEGITLWDIMYSNRPTTGGLLETLNLVAIKLIEMRMNAIPYGTGMVHEPGSGFEQFFYRKVVPADGSWNESLSMPALPNPFATWVFQSGGTPIPRPTPSVPFDIVCHTTQTQRENLGAFLRWIVPSNMSTNPDYILVFYFGQYSLGIAGDGLAYLFEKRQPGGEYFWTLRAQWRYCNADKVSGTNHTMTIYPHLGQRGEQRIIFSSNNLGVSSSSVLDNTVPTQEFLYVSTEIARQGALPNIYPPGVTTRSFFRLDVRRDIRLAWSLARLMFQREGVIIDSSFEMPPTPSAKQWKLHLHYRDGFFPLTSGGNPGGYIAASAFNARTNTALTAAAVAAGRYNVSNNVAGTAAPFFNIKFFGAFSGSAPKAQDSTPILYGYSLERGADIAAATTPEEGHEPIILGVHSVQVTDPGPSPKSASGVVETVDMENEHPRLRERGYLHTKVVVNYWPKAGEAFGPESAWPAAAYNGTVQKVVIHNGLALRPRHSKLSPDGDLPGACTKWRVVAALAGMSAIAGEVSAAALTYQQFAVEAGAGPADTKSKPFKVTDAIRMMLSTRFRDNYINIPDIDIRLYGALGQGKGDLEFEPHTDVVDRCSALARNYLGQYLVYELNAGIIEPDGSPGGAWTLRQVKPASGLPRARFFTAPLTTPFPGMNPCGYVDGGLPGIPLTEPLTEYTSPPEANHIWVFAAPPETGERYMKVDFHAYNHQSYKVPGSSVTPNPASPHYIGHEKLLAVPAPELWLAGDYEATRRACEVVARRLLQFAGCARKVVAGPGPLAIIWDNVLERYRPLQYGDEVTLNGESGWIVRSASPSYSLDTNQVANYELEKLLGHNDPGVEEEE